MAISQDWWDEWWEQDYSWDGLAKKPWQGWVVPEDGVPVPRGEGVKGRPANLQDYWKRAGLEPDIDRPEFQCPETGRRFTRVHLPLHFRDGSATLKEVEDPAFKESLDSILSAELSRPTIATEFRRREILRGADHRLQWRGGVFQDFQVVPLLSVAGLAGKAKVSLDAYMTAFSGITFFENVTFLNGCRFQRAKFLSYAFFQNSFFVGGVNFNSATFPMMTDFSNVVFSGVANFRNVTFEGYTEFGSTAFLDDSNFAKSTFMGPAEFSHAAFLKSVDFGSVAFLDRMDFSATLVLGNANFAGEGRSLSTTTSKQSLVLVSASSNDTATWRGSVTSKSAPLDVSRRSVERFIAHSAVFVGPVDFSNRDILSGSPGEISDFYGAYFFDLFKLHGAVLHRGINFGKTNVEKAIERGATLDVHLPVPKAMRMGLESLKRAMLEEPNPINEDVSAPNREVHELKLAVYSGDIESFQKWRKNRARKFTSSKVTYRGEYFRALEDCYRTLKLFNEDRRDRPEEGRFHRLELIARRRRRPNYSLRELFSLKREKVGIPMWERMLSHIYGWGSNYGNSVVLPIGWLLGGVFAFAGLYLLMGDGFVHAPNLARFGEALNFSFGRVFPFGPWDAPEACSAIGQMLDPLTDIGKEACEAQLGDAFEARTYKGGTPLTLRLLASFQSLSAIILVFLSGLAIRRRFQIN